MTQDDWQRAALFFSYHPPWQPLILDGEEYQLGLGWVWFLGRYYRVLHADGVFLAMSWIEAILAPGTAPDRKWDDDGEYDWRNGNPSNFDPTLGRRSIFPPNSGLVLWRCMMGILP